MVQTCSNFKVGRRTISDKWRYLIKHVKPHKSVRAGGGGGGGGVVAGWGWGGGLPTGANSAQL